MICGMTYYQILWYFLVYSFGGWIIEVIYQALKRGKVINRGFLNGPVCPVYGFGVLSVFALVNGMKSCGIEMNNLMIYLFGVFLSTAIELVAGWLLDVCFHARWWDYSKNPLNFHGYICLEFSLIWGFAILLVVHVFQDFVDNQAMSVFPEKIGWILLIILYAFYFADFAVTVAIIQGFNRKLSQLDQIREDMRKVSDKLSTRVGETTISTARKMEKGKIQAALARAEFKESVEEKRDEMKEAAAERREAAQLRREESAEELRERYEALQKRFEELSSLTTAHNLVGSGHLLRAFPEMKHHNYPEVLTMLRDKLNNEE